MDVVQAIVLGLVQSLGEFLPISSSAHLVLMPYVAGWEYQGLSYDVLLHFATLLAVVGYFYKDWLKIIKDGFTQPKTQSGKMLWLLAVATIPGALAGYFLHDMAESVFRNPLMISICLMFFALVLFLADRKTGKNKSNFLTLNTAIIIGLAQALAIMPGVSRSGITITACLILGFARPQSARISFLLSAPIIFGATLFELNNFSFADLTMPMVVGFLTALVMGFLAIKFLMHFVKTHSFNIFVIYRIILGISIILFYFR